MTLPAALLGILISTIFGALFHLWRGGGLGRLILYLILGWVGFWIGQAVGSQFNWNFLSLGPLRLGVATLSSLVFLGIGYWLSLVEVEKK
jgi:hypothetical protein